MEELIEKIENVKTNLEKSEQVKNIKRLNKELSNNKELLNKIERYNITQDEKLHQEIINNKFFREYKLSENEINYIILEINSRLKSITKKGSCSKWK